MLTWFAHCGFAAWDVTTALERGMIRRDDIDHLEFAKSQGRALYSFNIGDYQQLHSEYLAHGKGHSGIILAQQQRYNIGEQMRRLLKIIAQVSREEVKDSIMFLSAW